MSTHDFGGRVDLENFQRLCGLILSMLQCNDFFLGTRQISMGRDPNGDPVGVYWLQGVHMIHCVYISMWIGQMIQPDRDMFQSDHLCAKFHIDSRAICGGFVYVSDSVGRHDFDLIGKFFRNPLFDDEMALKIWNLNKIFPSARPVSLYHHLIISMIDILPSIQLPRSRLGPKGEENRGLLLLLPPDLRPRQLHARKLLLKTMKSGCIHITFPPSSFEIFTFVRMQSRSH
ncbi:hypothetical protein MLD38_028155 [Melastoma candidum]|uniref:Uncharacterized protein n=1 Tax=Melastoma candidum TaxID=119954 RepID=A0ACB9N678_9MYRT|nr:hypothetical protein MLD38_028155 [Melastoma candidum]